MRDANSRLLLLVHPFPAMLRRLRALFVSDARKWHYSVFMQVISTNKNNRSIYTQGFGSGMASVKAFRPNRLIRQAVPLV